jgi:hypothetical protein
MKSFLNNSYDKLFFVTTILTLISTSCYSFLISDEIDNITSTSYDVKDNWTRSPDGYYYESDVSMSLMPGEKISFIENKNNDRNFTQVKIVRIVFKRRSSLVVYLKDGTELDGTVKAKEGVTFNLNWRKSNQPILIDVGNKIRSIPSRDIDRVFGKAQILFRKRRGHKKADKIFPFLFSNITKENHILNSHQKSPSGGS